MTKHYFGIASIIFASACLIWSIGQAIALPQGPNTSLGSNPVFSVSSVNYATHVIYTNNTTSPAIITDFIAKGYINYNCERNFTVSNSSESISMSAGADGIYHMSLQSGLKVPAGESLEVSGGNYCSNVSISGYYSH